MIRSTFRAITGQPRATWRRALTAILAAVAISSTAMPAQALIPVPSAPLSPVVSASGNAGGETTLTTTWLAPLYSPGTVVAYQVQYTSDQGATWVNAPDVVAPLTSSTISGLTAGSSYIVRVRAVDIVPNASAWAIASPKLDRFTQVATGGDASCGVLRSGLVMCWGSNGSGELGDGTTVDRPSPVYVQGLTNVKSITLGAAHACAVLADGSVWCWGANTAGQLGDGTTTSSLVPVVVSGIANVTSVAAGLTHTCALDAAGLVYCWGQNSQGQLGIGTTTNALTPNLPIAGLTGVSSIALGDAHSCAVLAAGTVSCWGANASGQLGDGTTTRRLVPTAIPAFTGVTQVDAGDSLTCARLNTSAVRCWGANAVGQIGDGTTVAKLVPTAVTGIATATEVSVGSGFACARLNTSAVRCWGYNVGGQLGDGTVTNRSTSVAVTGLTTANTVSAAGVHACSLLAAGTVSCWGSNNAGQLGNGSRDAVRPGLVGVQPSGIVSLTTGYSGNGYSHTCALLSDGRVACWGNNTSGEVGNGTVQSPAAPTEVSGLTNVISIAGGADHTCAVRSDGTVWCWGSNAFGQLGTGDLVDSSTPVQSAIGTNNAVSVAAHSDNTCIIRSTGGVACWGVNTNGQVGLDPLLPGDASILDPIAGTTTEVYWAPVEISGFNGDGTGLLTNAQQLAVGAAHVCALLDDTTAWCWGANGAGELGNGCDPKAQVIDPITGQLVDPVCDSAFPVDNGGFSGTTITAGDAHTCLANAISGSIYCWGDNNNGQIGNNDPTIGNGRLPVLTPTAVFGIATPTSTASTLAVDVVAGSTHTCAIMADSTMQCWGGNGAGELKQDFLAVPRAIAPLAVPGVSRVQLETAGGSHTCIQTTDGTFQCWGYQGPDLAADPNGLVMLIDTVGRGAFGNATLNASPITLGAVPSIPLDVQGSPDNTQVLVSWLPSNANGSIVTGYTVTATPGGRTCTTTGATQCIVTALTNGTPYTFSVRATNAFGTSAASAPSAPIAPAGVPSAPTNVLGVKGDLQASVSWTAANGGGITVDSYDVYVYVNSVLQPTLGCTTPGTLSCIVTGLTNGVSYQFTVSATNAIGQSLESFPSGLVVPSGKPFPVTAVGVTRTATTATITWTPGGSNGAAISSYTATASNGGGSCVNIVGVTSPANSCTITGLVAGNAYSFTVYSTNVNGDSLLTAVGAPSGLAAVRGDHKVSLSWVAPVGGDSPVASYTVTATPGGATCATSIASPTPTACEITGLTNGTSYSFTVVATDGLSQQTASSPVSAIPAGVPFKATAVGVTRSGSSAMISWTAAANNGDPITGYTVTAAPGGATCTTTGATSCTIDGLSLTAGYTFTVVATNSVGDSLGKVVAAPANFAAVRGDHEVTLSWTSPAGGESAAVSYLVTNDVDSKSCATVSANPNTCTITGLTNGTNYTFTLVATDGLGQTTEAAQVSAIPAGIPFAVAKPTAVFGDHSATVSWTAPDNNGDAITKYTVTSSPGDFKCESATTSCVVTGLTNGASYTFTVTATNAVGTSTASVASDAVIPAGAPLAPAFSGAVSGDHTATLTWGVADSNGRDVTGYVVTSNVEGVGCTTAADVKTCEIVGLTNGTEYIFHVAGINVVGTGTLSAPETVIPAAAPLAPAIITGVAADRQITLNWDAADANGRALTGYVVTSNVSGVGCSTAPDVRTCVITGLTNGTKYTFQVAGINILGIGTASAASAQVVPFGKPTAVLSAKVNGILKVKYLLIGVRGATSNGSAITGYKIKYAFGTSKKFTAWKLIKPNGVFNVVGWPRNSTIKIQVASVNAAGQTISKLITVKTPK